MLLEVKNISVFYGQVQAINQVSLDVGEGEIVTLIGANGAGKTTVLNTISGLLSPASGEIRFAGQRIDGLEPSRVVGIGISQIPEGRRVFPFLTVNENIEIGAYLRKDKGGIKRDRERLFHMFPVLRDRMSQMARTLSGGEQQMLAVARALMAKPRLLLMDEPTLGLSPLMCQEVARMIQQINQEGITIVLVEQNCQMAFSLAQRGYVLETGRMTLQGDADELRNNEHVKKAYLGA